MFLTFFVMSAVQNDTLKINHCVNRAAPVSIYRDWPASLKVIQLPLSKSIICGSQAPRSVWIIVIKYLQRGKISQFSCWKNVRACSSYDLTRGSYSLISLSPVLPGDVPITGGWWTRSNTMRNRKTDQLK